MAQQQEAVLIMDSRQNNARVRSSSYFTMWSKLYKVGDAYLDISLKNEGTDVVLVGQVVSNAAPVGGHVVLFGSDHQIKHAQGLDEFPKFRFELEQSDTYHMEMRLGQERYVVSNLSFN